MSSYFLSASSPASSRLLLFCLPYAGGNAAVYRDWVAEAPVWLEVCPVELPGRGKLLRDAFSRSLPELARDIAEQIASLGSREYALFGHSMGAILACEIAAELEALRFSLPRQVFVSGALPPFLTRDKPPVSGLHDGAFLEHLRKLDGTPQEILDDPGAMEFFLPILRSDFCLVESYLPTAPRLLRVPLTVLRGQEDEGASADKMQLWQRVTTNSVTIREYPGGHFFFSEPAVRQDVFHDLERLRSEH
jgi:surfactin synthase thioesterase subunit